MASVHDVLQVWWGNHTFHRFQGSCAEVMSLGVLRSCSTEGKGWGVGVTGNFPENKSGKLKLKR